MKLLPLLFLASIFSVNAEPQLTKKEHPSFQLDAKAKSMLIEKAKNVKQGDSYRSVIKKLGTPTYYRTIVRKENSRVIGRNLSYYAVIWEYGSVNEKKDELVDIFLDENNRVKSIKIRVKLE